MTLIKRAFAVILVAWSASAYSALAPSALHLRDLNTMVDFIREHQFVAMTLENIDLSSLTVFYNNNCEAKFIRKKPSLLNLGRPGPQPRIAFKNSTCALNEAGESSH